MRAARLILVMVVISGLAAVAASATHVEYGTLDECMGALGMRPGGTQGCTGSDTGGWRGLHPTPSDPRSIFATFLVIWLILVAGSVWWVVSTARQHGDPVGTALFGALVGGLCSS